MTIERRIIKSPFTKEEREGVFVTREESRLRRDKMSMHKIPLTEVEKSGLEKHKLSTDKPSQLSDCFRLGVQHATQKFNETVVQLCKEKNALQAKIDQLMLEFCPEEMTQEQIENWQQHQVVSTHSKLIITTGDDVSKVVWTEEKLEELQRVVDKIKKEEQSSKQCCDNNKWGHSCLR